jgi:TM2 domain-containing membrane protein YozV
MQNKEILHIQVSLIVMFLSFASVSFSQNRYKCDLKFIDHLIDRGDFKEALYLLDSTDCLSDRLNDSVNYMRGWSLYSLKQLSSSSENLIKVTPGSEFYLKSHFFAAYNNTYTGDYNIALRTLSEISIETEKLLSLKNFENSGIYLLQGNMSMYENSFSKINSSFYEISESADNLRKISMDLKKHKTKSPLIAGILSGIIPGSGKFYSGKKGEAISSFIATTGLGLITWENYRKSGLNSFKTIVFGTAFAFSYTANIYGAVVSVNILETEYRNNVKNSILFNMHIPLRNTFSK